MTISSHKPSRIAAFTLIELLVVIGIIAVLAGMIIPAVAVAARSARLKRASAELQQLVSVIGRYKAEKGFYPPDNPNNYAMSQLFYELTGTYRVNGVFQRINGSETIDENVLTNTFPVGGFMNSSAVSSVTNLVETKEAEVRNFWPGLEPGKYAFYLTNGAAVIYLGMTLDGPETFAVTNNNAVMEWNPWHYNSSNPTNNPDSYDLWIDLKLSSPMPFANPKYKIYRISNWSAEPVVVQ